MNPKPQIYLEKIKKSNLVKLLQAVMVEIDRDDQILGSIPHMK